MPEKARAAGPTRTRAELVYPLVRSPWAPSLPIIHPAAARGAPQSAAASATMK